MRVEFQCSNILTQTNLNNYFIPFERLFWVKMKNINSINFPKFKKNALNFLIWLLTLEALSLLATAGTTSLSLLYSTCLAKRPYFRTILRPAKIDLFRPRVDSPDKSEVSFTRSLLSLDWVSMAQSEIWKIRKMKN